MFRLHNMEYEHLSPSIAIPEPKQFARCENVRDYICGSEFIHLRSTHFVSMKFTIRIISACSIFLVLACSGVLHAQSPFWSKSFGPYGGDIESLTSGKNGIVYAGTDSGVFRSFDEGMHWEKCSNGIGNEEVFTLHVTNNGWLLAGTEDTGVYRTSDMGSNWERSSSGIPDGGSILTLISNPAGTIFAGTALHGIYRSFDNGKTWSAANNGLMTTGITAFQMDTVRNMFLVGTAYGTYRSDLTGDQWQQIDTLSSTVASIVFDSLHHILEATTKVGIRISSDNGATWNSANVGLPQTAMRRLVVGAHGETFLGTVDSGMYWTRNNGASWQEISNGLTDSTILSMTMSTSGYLFIGSLKAFVYRSNVSVKDVVSHANTNSPNDISLTPNPCSSFVRIGARTTASDLTAQVFDIYGREVVSAAGHVLNTSALVSGIYLCAIRTNGQVTTKRLAVVR
jgi:photosystem II stability/assembly factor-like uncharacterized protein